MLSTVDRYLLGQVISKTLAMTGIGLVALLLERALRILEFVGEPGKSFGLVPKMLVFLIPHYLGIAFPAAFFFGILLTFNRMFRDNELVVLFASGNGLHRLMAPVMWMAFVMTLIAALIWGFLQPYARYQYRSLQYDIAHASLSTAVKEGTFIQVDGMTFFAEGPSRGGGGLSRIFVHEEESGGGSFVTTGENGALVESPDGAGPVLILEHGARTEITKNGTVLGTIRFDRFSWPIEATDPGRYPDRGSNERELTLPELWEPGDRPFSDEIQSVEITAEIHSRLVNIATMLILPLLAVPLALGGGRGGQTYGIAVGLFILVVYQKAINFGEALGDDGILSPWIGLWLPFCVLTAIGCYLFFRAAFKVTNLPWVNLATMVDTFANRLEGSWYRRATLGRHTK